MNEGIGQGYLVLTNLVVLQPARAGALGRASTAATVLRSPEEALEKTFQRVWLPMKLHTGHQVRSAPNNLLQEATY
jgi:hypothetical protein